MAKLVRKLIQKIGLDLHRYYPEPDKLAWLSQLNIKTVLDIGANVGQFAKQIRNSLPQARIISFEPLTDCYVELSKNMSQDTNFCAFNLALGNTETKTIIHKSAHTPSSSILPMAKIHKEIFPHTQTHSQEQITIKQLDDVAGRLNLTKEILIKIDVQGYEDRVIEGGLKTFSEAKAVILEISFVPLYEGQPSFNDLYHKLNRLGFIYRGSLGHKLNPVNGQVISEDCLFVR